MLRVESNESWEGEVVMEIRQEVELAVRVASEPSDLKKLFTAVALCYRDIIAWSFHSDHEQALAFLVTANESHTRHALASRGLECTTSRVLLVRQENGLGSAIEICAILRANSISLLKSYASSIGGKPPFIILKTTDDARARTVLASHYGISRPMPEPIHLPIATEEALPQGSQL